MTAASLPSRLRRGARRAAPWAVSAGVHAAVAVVLGAALMFTAAEPPIVVADGRLADLPGRSLDAPPIEPSFQTTVPQVAAAEVPAVAGAVALDDPAADSEDLGLIGIEADGTAPGLELDVAALAAAPIPRADFFGAGGTAGRIVYVVDGSGSMDNALGTPDSPGPVRWELIRSISRLGPDQQFQLIFFTTGRPKQFPDGGLIAATDDAKRRAAAFMAGVRPDVGTDPIPALRAAFASLAASRGGDGKVIYLLTDGFELDHRRLIEALATMNAGRDVRLHIVLYDELPETARSGSTLRDLAERHGGQFQRVLAGQ